LQDAHCVIESVTTMLQYVIVGNVHMCEPRLLQQPAVLRQPAEGGGLYARSLVAAAAEWPLQVAKGDIHPTQSGRYIGEQITQCATLGTAHEAVAEREVVIAGEDVADGCNFYQVNF